MVAEKLKRSHENINDVLDSFELQSRVRDDIRLLRELAENCENEAVAEVEKLLEQFPRDLESEIAALQEAENIGEHMDIIVELLELPRVMQALVAGQRHEEAIDVQAQLLRLLSRPMAAQLPILRQVALQIHKTSLPMVRDLLVELGNTQKLSLCLKIVGYLRRLQAFSEAELQILFLQVRLKSFKRQVEQHLQKSSSASSVNGRASDQLAAPFGENAAEFLKQYLDLARACIFDTITQYTAIFQDFNGETSQSPGGRAVDLDGDGTSRTSHLASFMVSLCNGFVGTLSSKLPLIKEVTVLSSIFTSCMYLGLSVSRLGFDMRNYIVQPFCDQVVRLFKQSVQPVFDYSINVLCKQNLALISQSLAYSSLSPDSTSRTESFLQTLESAEPPSPDSLEPPSVLMQCSPLAWILNAVYGAYNQLRIFPLTMVYGPIAEYIDALVAELQNAVAQLQDDSNEYKCLDLLVGKFLVPSIVAGYDLQLFKSCKTKYLKSKYVKVNYTADVS